MKEFNPGFRLSLLDVIILILGVVGTLIFLPISKINSFIIAFVVGHFFLFCNVFRISRPLELIWATLLILFGVLIEIFRLFNWYIVAIIMVAVTFGIILIEMRKKSYHGIMWQRFNPNLVDWFKDTN